MRRRVNCGLKERQEQVPQKLSKIVHHLPLLVDVTGTSIHICTHNEKTMMLAEYGERDIEEQIFMSFGY